MRAGAAMRPLAHSPGVAVRRRCQAAAADLLLLGPCGVCVWGGAAQAPARLALHAPEDVAGQRRGRWGVLRTGPAIAARGAAARDRACCTATCLLHATASPPAAPGVIPPQLCTHGGRLPDPPGAPTPPGATCAIAGAWSTPQAQPGCAELLLLLLALLS